jgi:uncharacterized protein
VWDLIESAKFNELPNDILFDLVGMEILVSDNQNEMELILKQNNESIIDDERLYLVIHPSAFCQLGCGYCGQQHQQRNLSEEHQDLFLERTRSKLSTKKFKILEVAWFGGEPLVGIAVIRRLAPRLKELATIFGCKYKSKIVTNGLSLIPSVVTELIHNYNIGHIEITLDGTAEYHNRRRHTKEGSPTFDTIFKNVIDLANRSDSNIRITIRCNVDRRNYEGVIPLLHLIAKAGIQKRVGFYVAAIHSWGNDAHLESLSKEEFADLEIKWYSTMIQLGFKINMIPPRKKIVCIALSNHGEVLDANGDLFNCTEVSYVPQYGLINKYGIGNLNNGEITGRRKTLGDFNDRIANSEYDCSECRMLPVCGGACPKLWQEGIIPCPSAKFNMERRLLLEYAKSKLSTG